MDITEIINLLATNPDAAIRLLEGIYYAKQLTKDQFVAISKKIKHGLRQKEFGFSASDELADRLRKIDSTPDYLKLKQLIGNHPTLRLARIGLYLETLNKEGSTRIVNDIRDEIIKNHGDDGFKIIDLGSSGLMSGLIESLSDLKSELNLLPYEVVKEYEININKLKFRSLFVKRETSQVELEQEIMKKIKQKPSYFHIVAAGNALECPMLVIAKMNAHIFRDNGYTFISPKIINHGETRKQYIWTFYLFL